MIKGFIFDLDGTVYLGNKLLDGAAETIQTLRARGDRVVFLTNKPIASRRSYVDKLTAMGIPTTDNDVLNSSQIVAQYLQGVMALDERVFIIGENPICEELRNHNIRITDNSEEAHYVVLSWDRQFTYDKLNKVYQAAMRGATVIASNPDTTCPLDGGQIPDTGTMIAALEAATGRPIDLVIGKPSLIAAKAAMDHLGLESEHCYMVGDRLETDIKMGNDAGMTSILVLTGVSTEKMLERTNFPPKHVVSSIKDIIHL